MIPPDVASSLRQLLPDQQSAANLQAQPVAGAQKLADVLADLQPGQRIMAEIQALLPNGSYRAIVSQRDITLALPFSAKPGDTLELEVTETDGKLALAFVANRGGETKPDPAESVPTRLSQTGQLIGDLLGQVGEKGSKAAPAPLNGNQALVDQFPASAQDLAPVLKEALTKSGMFYEAHQARWVAGELPTEHLLQEPQGRLSPAHAAEVAKNTPPARELPAVAPLSDTPVAPKAGSDLSAEPARQSAQGPLPSSLTPIVQQQLDAMATQTYAWQGQIWPGQQMFWEIDEHGSRQPGTDIAEGNSWRTRLKLDLPELGGIEASLALHPGGEVRISVVAANDASRGQLESAAGELSHQFEAAGLRLNQLLIKHGSAAE